MCYPRLKELREAKNLTQSRVAAVLGIPQNTYSDYEKGKRKLPLWILVSLSDFYRTSTDYILGRTDVITQW